MSEKSSENLSDKLPKIFIKRTCRLWNEFWFASIQPHPICAFRILFGIYLFIYFIRYLPNVDLMFSNAGIYSPIFIPDIAPPPLFAWMIYTLTIASILAFIVGFKTRIITPLLLLLFLYHFFLNFAVKNCSYDRLIIIFLGLMSLSEVNSVWSVKPKGGEVSAWLTRLLCVQVTLFYFGAGLYKALQPIWSNGEILRQTLVSNWGTPLAFWLSNKNLPIQFYDALTFLTVWLETFLGFFLWIRPIQKFVFVLGFLFHLSVWILLSIPEFMICVLTYVLFVPADELEKFGNLILKITKNKLSSSK